MMNVVNIPVSDAVGPGNAAVATSPVNSGAFAGACNDAVARQAPDLVEAADQPGVAPAVGQAATSGRDGAVGQHGSPRTSHHAIVEPSANAAQAAPPKPTVTASGTPAAKVHQGTLPFSGRQAGGSSRDRADVAVSVLQNGKNVIPVIASKIATPGAASALPASSHAGEPIASSVKMRGRGQHPAKHGEHATRVHLAAPGEHDGEQKSHPSAVVAVEADPLASNALTRPSARPAKTGVDARPSHVQQLAAQQGMAAGPGHVVIVGSLPTHPVTQEAARSPAGRRSHQADITAVREFASRRGHPVAAQGPTHNVPASAGNAGSAHMAVAEVASSAAASQILPETQSAIVSSASGLIAAGGGTARITMHPQTLGSVVLTVKVHGNGVADVHLATSTHAGLHALSATTGILSQHIANAGLTVGSVQAAMATSAQPANVVYAQPDGSMQGGHGFGAGQGGSGQGAPGRQGQETAPGWSPDANAPPLATTTDCAVNIYA